MPLKFRGLRSKWKRQLAKYVLSSLNLKHLEKCSPGGTHSKCSCSSPDPEYSVTDFPRGLLLSLCFHQAPIDKQQTFVFIMKIYSNLLFYF